MNNYGVAVIIIVKDIRESKEGSKSVLWKCSLWECRILQLV